jgi:hypothetical protein
MGPEPTPTLVPQAFWFRLAVPCYRIEGMDETPEKPKAGPRARPAKATVAVPELGPTYRLPDLAGLDGMPGWADLRAGWSEAGLVFAVRVDGPPRSGLSFDPELSPGLDVWVDTRDSREGHRATRFAHRFAASMRAGRAGPATIELTQKTIHRALADAPRARMDAAETTRGQWSRTGWSLDWLVPAADLHGFEPESNRRLGFLAIVRDPARGEQFLGVGREFPVESDPSLWITLELKDVAPPSSSPTIRGR